MVLADKASSNLLSGPVGMIASCVRVVLAEAFVFPINAGCEVFKLAQPAASMTQPYSSASDKRRQGVIDISF
jgi:hypothetical protein